MDGEGGSPPPQRLPSGRSTDAGTPPKVRPARLGPGRPGFSAHLNVAEDRAGTAAGSARRGAAALARAGLG